MPGQSKQTRPKELIDEDHCAVCGDKPRTLSEAPCGHCGCLDCFKGLLNLTGDKPHGVCPTCDGVFYLFWHHGGRFYLFRKPKNKKPRNRKKDQRRARDDRNGGDDGSQRGGGGQGGGSNAIAV